MDSPQGRSWRAAGCTAATLEHRETASFASSTCRGHHLFLLFCWFTLFLTSIKDSQEGQNQEGGALPHKFVHHATKWSSNWKTTDRTNLRAPCSLLGGTFYVAFLQFLTLCRRRSDHQPSQSSGPLAPHGSISTAAETEITVSNSTWSRRSPRLSMMDAWTDQLFSDSFG